jgi:outer membrane protein TolC
VRRCIALFILLCFIAAESQYNYAWALTLEEALALAKETVPAYRAVALKVKATDALATASLGPYFPQIDAQASSTRHDIGPFFPDYSLTNYQLSGSWTLFDGGKRFANRQIALLNLDNDGEELRRTLINLEYNVKVAFYTALSKRDSLQQRQLQLADAQRDYEIAQGRHKYGLVKLSDTLQASVRLDQAKYNVVTADGDLRKAVADLNSLVGYVLNAKPPLEGSLEFSSTMPVLSSLYEAALQKPELKQAADAIKIASFNRAVELSAFWPSVSADAGYLKTKGVMPGSLEIPEDRTVGVSLTWNIFEFGKFFRQKSAAISTEASEATLEETKRTLLLAVQKADEDLVTAASKIIVAREQLSQAEHNYNQALGEYKIGKADILSLVQAETLLSDARNQMIISKLDVLTAKSQLEQVAGVQELEALPFEKGLQVTD